MIKFLSLFLLYIRVCHCIKFVNWTDTICGCIEPDCDRPWTTWGYVVNASASEKTTIGGLKCVMLINYNVSAEKLSIPVDIPELATQLNSITLKYLFDHIYFDDINFIRNLKLTTTHLTTRLSNGSTFDLENRRLVPITTYTLPPTLEVKFVKSFKLYRLSRANNAIEYHYLGFHIDKCCNSFAYKFIHINEFLGI